jgi:hypothetical protein
MSKDEFYVPAMLVIQPLHAHSTLELGNLEHAQCRLAADPLNETETVERG